MCPNILRSHNCLNDFAPSSSSRFISTSASTLPLFSAAITTGMTSLPNNVKDRPHLTLCTRIFKQKLEALLKVNLRFELLPLHICTPHHCSIVIRNDCESLLLWYNTELLRRLSCFLHTCPKRINPPIPQKIVSTARVTPILVA